MHTPTCAQAYQRVLLDTQHPKKERSDMCEGHTVLLSSLLMLDGVMVCTVRHCWSILKLHSHWSACSPRAHSPRWPHLKHTQRETERKKEGYQIQNDRQLSSACLTQSHSGRKRRDKEVYCVDRHWRTGLIFTAIAIWSCNYSWVIIYYLAKFLWVPDHHTQVEHPIMLPQSWKFCML